MEFYVFGAIVQASFALHIFQSDPPFPFLATPLSKAASAFIPLESPSIYVEDGSNRNHQLLNEGGVKALPAPPVDEVSTVNLHHPLRKGRLKVSTFCRGSVLDILI